MIVPYVEAPKKRFFGPLKGTLNIPDYFDEESEEINQMFYGSDKKA
jgi:hypothetical protein